MTPTEFTGRMKEIAAMKGDIGIVKALGMTLIVRALGEGAPAFLPGLEVFLKRLEAEPAREPKIPPEPIA